MDFGARVAAGDPSLFAVASQTSNNDRRSLLLLQNLVRQRCPGYAYLEIGSHVGGSIYPHLLDERCHGIVSIDPRPPAQPDERGVVRPYAKNSTARMIHILESAAGPRSTAKLKTLDVTSDSVSKSDVGPGVHLALIDGEHTNRAAFRDFCNVLQLTEDDCLIGFHDANILIDAIWNVARCCAILAARTRCSSCLIMSGSSHWGHS